MESRFLSSCGLCVCSNRKLWLFTFKGPLLFLFCQLYQKQFAAMYNYSRPLCRHSLNTHAEARQRAAAQKADAFPPAAGPGEDCSSSLTWPAKVAPDGAPETLNKAPATRQKGALQAVNEIDLHETHVNQ